LFEGILPRVRGAGGDTIPSPAQTKRLHEDGVFFIFKEVPVINNFDFCVVDKYHLSLFRINKNSVMFVLSN
jgi:hypothetical protein